MTNKSLECVEFFKEAIVPLENIRKAIKPCLTQQNENFEMAKTKHFRLIPPQELWRDVFLKFGLRNQESKVEIQIKYLASKMFRKSSCRISD